VMQNFINVTLPWLADVIDACSEHDYQAELERRREAEAARGARPVPIGFKHSLQLDAPALGRDRSLVLVGWRPALMWLFDQAMNAALVANDLQVYTVIRFMETAPRDKEVQPRLCRLGANAWKSCANTNDSLIAMLEKHVDERLTANPDLLMIDDLAQCYSASFVGRPAAANAGDANRMISKWCREHFCAVIGGLPQDEPGTPDISGQEYEQLKQFTWLRALHVAQEGDHYHLSVANATEFRVPCDVIDAYRSSNIIVPVSKIIT
jgi:hypothetical protein